MRREVEMEKYLNSFSRLGATLAMVLLRYRERHLNESREHHKTENLVRWSRLHSPLSRVGP
ncbi:hypothetical protein TorRG33x02_250710 [Trema orientale]|uniref:Uncharacterized protein n=1 Tax=Trema orientale TaxID=63057 RepID=A0A2P5DIL9_TREOI|nr:hypothetical protein TorRG33x02_250710 [Trema orientale]